MKAIKVCPAFHATYWLKRSSVIIALLHFILMTASGQWIPMNSITNLNLSVIHQTPSGSLLVAGNDNSESSGIIIKSDNGGFTWYSVAVNSKGFSDIAFPSATMGIAIPKSKDTIFKTFDGANTWQSYYSLNCFGGGYGFPQVVFTDSVTGYAPGYQTSDGGSSWVLQNHAVNFFPFVPVGIIFLNDSTGIVVGYGYSGGTYKTTDRGITWLPVPVPYWTWEIYSAYFPTASIGYCTGNKYQSVHESEILKTVDGGDTWSSIYTHSPFVYYLSVFCNDSNTCYAVGSGGNIIKTTDGGITWGFQSSGTTRTLRKVFFTDANTGYIVGDSGTILKTINGGGPLGIPESASKDDFDVFPVPAHDELTIRYNSNESFQFIMYNALGDEETHTAVNRKKARSICQLIQAAFIFIN